MPSSDKVPILKRSLIFSTLTEDELAELAGLATELTLALDEFVFWEDDSPDWF